MPIGAIPIIILALLTIPLGAYLIIRKISKNKAEGKSNKIIYTVIISVALIIVVIIPSTNFIGEQIANNRISGVWETGIEILELQRRDNRVYINNVFEGYWSVHGLRWGNNSGSLVFRFLDDTTQRYSIRLENNDNTFIISVFVEGERIDVADYWRLE